MHPDLPPRAPPSLPAAGAPPPAVEISGPGHRVLRVNDAFCRLLGETRTALLGRPLAELLPSDEFCAALPELFGDQGGPAPGSTVLRTRWPAADVLVILAGSRETASDIAAMNEALLVGSVRQHELRADAEAAVRERTAQLRASLEQMEAFSYTLAHDLRAPVRAIQGFALLAREAPGGEAWQGAEFLDRISRAAARMESLIQDVLSLNRVASRPAPLAPIDVEALARALVTEHRTRCPGAVDIRIEGELPRMLGHESGFAQSLANLLENAVKFVVPGDRPRVRLWAESRGARVRLWVEDEGVGVPPEHRAKIFELFQRMHSDTAYEGTGLGLAIVKKAMHRMGGAVGVESANPRGSRFWLELPRA